MVAALEQAWSEIRARHTDVPPAVIVVGSGSPSRPSMPMKLGHFVESQWQYGIDVLSEVLVSGEGLSRAVDEVLATLLHEAAHGVAFVRKVQDTSRQGRWHNRRFAQLASELGLVVEQSPKIGWSVTTLGPGTRRGYGDVVDVLYAALQAYRRPTTLGTSKASTRNGAVLVCTCGRKIRASTTVAAQGPIVCGVCNDVFLAEDAD